MGSWLRLITNSANANPANVSELLTPAEAILAEARVADFTRDSAVSLAEHIERAKLDIFALVERAIEDAHENAVTMLLFATIFSGQQIPAPLLGRAIPLLDRIRLVGVFVGRASGDRLGMLLELAEGGQLGSEWHAFCLLVAVKLLGGQPAPARLLAQIRLLGREDLSPDAAMVVGQITLEVADPDVYRVCGPWVAIAIERSGGLLSAQVGHEMFAALETLLPERGPKPVQRVAPKIGRNDACPCGSGKKAKRCCPERVVSVVVTAPPPRAPQKRLDALQPRELATMDLTALATRDLVEAFRTLAQHRFWQATERALEHLALRSDFPDGLTIGTCRGQLISYALRAGANEVVRRQAPRLGNCGVLPLIVELLEPNATLQHLDKFAALFLGHPAPGMIQELALPLLGLYPALGILVGRGAVDPRCPSETESLLAEIERARDRLHLPPCDLAAELYDGLFEREPPPAPEVAPSAPDACQIQESPPPEPVVPACPDEPARTEAIEPPEAPPPAEPPPAMSDLERKRLRGKIKELKALIGDGHKERAQLREQLTAAVARIEQMAARQPDEESPDEPDADHPDELEASMPARLHTLLPVFSVGAQEAVREAPAHIARAALRIAAALAGGEPAAWSSIKRLRLVDGLFSARIGIHHRLLFRLEPARAVLEVVAVIHRRELEATLRRMASGAA